MTSLGWTNRTARQVRSAIALFGATLLLSTAATAQDTTVSNEQGKLKRAQENIAALGPDLLGDQVNFYNGALEFVQTDTSLPGNNALPVAITRRHTAGRTIWIRTTLGDWDLELPRMSGVFPTTSGWVNGNNATNRCSDFSAPPTVFRPVQPSGGGARGRVSPPVGPSPPGSSPVGAEPNSDPNLGTAEFSPTEYWQGNTLIVPGGISEEVLKRTPGDSAMPADGQSWPLVTRSHWQLRCGTALQNGAGEGFIAISPEGVTYRFDWMATQFEPTLKKAGAALGRVRANLYATRVTDRFGNVVDYAFNAAVPGQLMQISSSDGRVISLGYDKLGRVQSVNDGSRVFMYSYTATGELYRVTRPDASYWEFNLRPLVHLIQSELGEGATCEQPGSFPEGQYTGTVRHPSGAVGTFVTAYTFHPRANVRRQCIYPPTGNRSPIGAVWPKILASQSLIRKTINGPGLVAGSGQGSMTWLYAYDGSNISSWAPCTNCTSTKTQTVTKPSGEKTFYTYGIGFEFDEGQLLTQTEGLIASRVTRMHYRQPVGTILYPEPAGISIQAAGDYLASRHRPMDEKRIEQQNRVFTWQVDPSTTSPAFDRFVMPTRVTKFSTLGDSRTETTAYEDNLSLWVLSQIKSVSVPQSAQPMESHIYFPGNAMRMSSSRFGKKLQSFDYAADGTMKTIRDAADHATSLQNYSRGSPQLILLPDDRQMSQQINNLGDPNFQFDAANFKTTYSYDAMGRLSQVTYPPDSAVAGGYYPTQQSFTQVPTDEFGLAGTHWKQTVSRGNAVTIRYFDALWRPRVEARYDAAIAGTTSSYQETRYDPNGRKSFESYPQRSFTFVNDSRNGTTYFYDTLDRMVRQTANSELGDLVTTHTYATNDFVRTTRNPRGFDTTFSFQAFDTPSEDSIRSIQAPANVQVNIVRDVFGKPSSITRSGNSAGVNVSVTRSYTYDANQRLCRTVEPETGATQQDYDLANNVAWRASGLAPQSGACNASNAPAARRVNFSYDALNRLMNTTYGDGSPGVSRTYTPDGLPETIATPTSTWTLLYSPLRKLTSEAIASVAGNYGVSYTYDRHGSVASMTYPGGPTLQYAPDALGRPTQIPGYLSAIVHHPNGQLASYGRTPSGGVNYSASQNARLLPQTLQYTLDNGSVVSSQTYGYDPNGNVGSIAQAPLTAASRSMGYDGLDRLTAANGIWGTGLFSYDAVDNLRASTVGSRGLTHSYDAANRLYAVSGSLNANLYYDANGNITQRELQGFNFDIANRLIKETLPVTTANLVRFHYYDGLGRRAYTEAYTAGQPAPRTTLRLYSQDGRLLMTFDSQKGNTQHFYVGNKLVAEYSSQTQTPARWILTDALGSPIAAANAGGALIDRTFYEPYGSPTALGSPYNGTNPDGIGFTGHVNDVDTGLVYMQQRYYDPIAGRFLSVDPVTTDAKTADHFNRYLYAAGNPYKYKDPDGRIIETAFDLVSFALSVQEYRSNPSVGNAIGVAVDAAAVAIPGVPGGVGAVRAAAKAGEAGAAAAKGAGVAKASDAAAKAMGDVKAATKGQLKGVDQHAVKEAVMGDGARISTHNISVDGSGNVVLTPVKKGGESLETGYNIKELASEFPKK